jgi:LacI family transcriptional regulator
MKSQVSKPTVIDVAREAGVSPMTVSRALNRPEKVAASTRNKILEVCDLLNYRPNASAQSLRTKTSRQIGVIIPDWRNAFWIDVVSGIEEVMTGAGFQLLIANSNEEQEQETLHIEAMLSRSVDSLLIAPTDGSTETIQALQRSGHSLVVIDRIPGGLKNVDCVTIDNEEGAYKATSHLLAVGHERIGLLAGNVNLDTGRQRLNGYYRALHEVGLTANERWIRTASTNAALVGKQVGYEGTRHFLDQDHHPTALLCTSNTIATGAFMALRECDVKIPTEIAFATFGNMDWTSLVTPTLTVVTQPTIEMGLQAAQMVLDHLGARDRDRYARKHVILEPQLIIRESSSAI